MFQIDPNVITAVNIFTIYYYYYYYYYYDYYNEKTYQGVVYTGENVLHIAIVNKSLALVFYHLLFNNKI